MRFDVVTLFPQMFDDFSEWGVTGRASKQGRIQIHTWNPRDYTTDVHGKVDDRPYGGGPGMVMKYEPLAAAITAAKKADSAAVKVIYLSPQGKPLKQSYAARLASEDRIILLAGRYEGIDERLVSDFVDEELSIGDYVLSGGEFAAFVVIDVVARLLPGTLGNSESAQQDSFGQGLLDCPHYTRPEKIKDKVVPQILMSGNHQAIEDWRLQQALGRTQLRRPELLAKHKLTTQQKMLLDKFNTNKSQD